MREIKFRAWVGTRKLMFQVREMIIPDGLNESGFQEIAATDNYSIVRPMHYIQPILMQYTGLKDCNGVEIYEGDIVKNGYETRLVKWRDYGFKLIPVKDAIGVVSFMGGRKRECKKSNVEVIGNIYENPELLK